MKMTPLMMHDRSLQRKESEVRVGGVTGEEREYEGL